MSLQVQSLKKLSLMLIPVSILCLPGALQAQCNADEIGVLSSRNNTLYEDAMGSLSNADGTYMFSGMSSAANGTLIRRALLHFDVSTAIPVGATITSVRLRLSSDATPIGTHDVSIHPVTSDWGNGTSDAGNPGNLGTAATTNDPTWLHTFYDTQFWTTEGGDYDPVALATVSIGTSGSFWWGSNAAMIAEVEAWFADPSTNYGWIVIGNETTADSVKRFNKRFNEPILCIGYTASGFQINTYTTNGQRRPDVAKHDNGFVVVWETLDSIGTDTNPRSIRGQRLDSSGGLVGGEFQVNTYTPGSQERPAVAAWPDGRFAVVWTDTTDSRVRGQLFNSDGSANGSELLVESATSISRGADVAVNTDSFVVVWSGEPGPADTDYTGVVGRRYASDGTAEGTNFQVNSLTTGYQVRPTIETDPSEGFVVVWVQEQYGYQYGLFGRRLTSTGAVSGAEFQVNSYTSASLAYQPSLDFDSTGQFVVAWTNFFGSPGNDNEYSSVVARRFDSSAMPIGSDFQVNTYTNYFQTATDVIFEPGDGFTVIWSNDDSDAVNVFGTRFDSGGTQVGLDFKISNLVNDYQQASRGVSDAQGNFMVVWESDSSAGTDTSLYSIQGRQLVAEADVGVTKSNGVDVVTAGGQTTYEVVVTNHGPDTATNVQLTDTLPGTLSCSWTSLEAGGASGNSANGVGNISETLLMPPLSTVTYELTCDVSPGATGTLSNTASVTADQTDNNSANDSATDVDNVTVSVDLGIALDADNTNTAPGAIRMLTATVTNNGPSSSTGSTVTSTLPMGLTFSSSSDCSEAMGVVTCAVGALAPSGQAFPSFDVTVDASLTNGEMITATASVTGNEADPSSGNDSDTVTLTVVTQTDVAVTKTDNTDTANPGGQVTYVIEVTNNGPHVAAGVSLTDTLPGDLTCAWTSEAMGGATGNTGMGSGNLNETLMLPVSATVTYTLVCDVDAAATGMLANTANVTHVTDTDSGNNSATDTDTLVAETDLSVSLVADSLSAVAGETSVFTATVTNNGPSPSTGGTLTSPLGPDVTFSSSADCTESGAVVTCAIGALAASEQVSVSYILLVNGGLADGATPINVASITGNETDSTGGNNADSVTLTVESPIFVDGFESGDTSAWTPSE